MEVASNSVAKNIGVESDHTNSNTYIGFGKYKVSKNNWFLLLDVERNWKKRWKIW